MRQRRIYISPTITYFYPSSYEESNRVIRQYKEQLSRFARLSFVSEALEKGFYFVEQSILYLGYIHNILTNGIQISDYKFRFLSYSNSQIKNHSCWVIANDRNRDGLSEALIIKSLGHFDAEKNVLKRYARRG